MNVLLSFAQFEREVTAERIRDKFAASRAKGIFMGGTPPLGYDARERKLVVNNAEAKTVRMIFKRYLELRSVGRLREELEAKRITTKAFVSTRGRAHRWRIAIEEGEIARIDDLAKREGLHRRRVRELLRLAFLAPDVQRAIVDGQQPKDLTLERLTEIGPPASWQEQRRRLGLVR